MIGRRPRELAKTGRIKAHNCGTIARNISGSDGPRDLVFIVFMATNSAALALSPPLFKAMKNKRKQREMAEGEIPDKAPLGPEAGWAMTINFH